MPRPKGSRNKKNINVHIDKKEEVIMSEENAVLAPEKELDNIQTELDLAKLELEKTKLALEEKKKELQFEPRREITQQEKEISQKQVAMKSEKSALTQKIEQQKAYDSVMITGKFLNRRAPGQEVKLTYQKYADDPVKWYLFKDGATYTIPRGFVDQINEYYHTPIFIQKEGAMDPDNPESQIAHVDTSSKKYAFVPLGF